MKTAINCNDLAALQAVQAGDAELHTVTESALRTNRR